MFETRSDIYKVFVIEEKATGQVVGSGSLVIERKFIRQLGLCGHIEDIAIRTSSQGQNLGKRMIELLRGVALASGCYKVILDCNEALQPFYEKCGFTVKGT